MHTSARIRTRIHTHTPPQVILLQIEMYRKWKFQLFIRKAAHFDKCSGVSLELGYLAKCIYTIMLRVCGRICMHVYVYLHVCRCLCVYTYILIFYCLIEVSNYWLKKCFFKLHVIKHSLQRRIFGRGARIFGILNLKRRKRKRRKGRGEEKEKETESRKQDWLQWWPKQNYLFIYL